MTMTRAAVPPEQLKYLARLRAKHAAPLLPGLVDDFNNIGEPAQLVVLSMVRAMRAAYAAGAIHAVTDAGRHVALLRDILEREVGESA